MIQNSNTSTKVRFHHLALASGLIAIMICTCKENGVKNLDQGEIHYNITYTGNTGSISNELKPKTLIITFKHDKMLFEILSAIGNAGITNISNPEEGIYDSYLSLFTLKYYYEGKPGEILPGFERMAGMDIHKTSKTAVICGLTCKNAEVTLPPDRNKIYNIWYTREINAKNPNIANPYRAIDGVLMNFFVFLGNTEVHFEAESIYKKNVPDEVFQRKKNYDRVSREDINKFITKMISL
jgi:hypothetical protein